MKKFIVLAAIVLMFSGCSNSWKVTPQDVANAYGKDFPASVKAVFGERETEMSVSKNGMSISITVNSPAELSGMGIEISDEHAKIGYKGMEQEIEKNSLPEGTPFLLLEELFEELSDPEEFTLSTENENIVADFGDFSAVLFRSSARNFRFLKRNSPFQILNLCLQNKILKKFLKNPCFFCFNAV